MSGTDHHEELQRDTGAEPQQREGADGDSGDGLAGPQELEAQGDGHVQVHAGVVLQHLHKHRPAPRGDESSSGLTQALVMPFGAHRSPPGSLVATEHPLAPPHSHVVDPSVLLQEVQLSSAFLQRGPQLLDVTTAVVERDVTPVPDPAGREEPWGDG